jgi:tRNA pseudouridine55 synthase
MATGVLLVGVGRATRLLGHLALHDKDYVATMRLGVTTSTDDAQGEPLARTRADQLAPGDVVAAMTVFTGKIEQRPPAVSAIKVDGVRAYARARSGEDVVLAVRRVTVSSFAATGFRSDAALGVLDVDVEVSCSSGTYIRALARDVGTALGVGGHLAALRRTRVGAFDLSGARTLPELETAFALTPLDVVAARAFARRDLDAAQALALSHGAKLPASGKGVEPVAAFGPDDELIALLEDRDGVARALAVFVG